MTGGSPAEYRLRSGQGNEELVRNRQPLTGSRATIAKIAAFLLPLLTWCVVSYVPFVWHPDVYITDPGDSDFLTAGQQLPTDQFAIENTKLRGEHQAEAKGYPANPIFLRRRTRW